MQKVSIFWFRRDLRLEDNVGLFHALKSGHNIIPLFIFDKNILNELPIKDKRVDFIYQSLEKIQKKLIEKGSSLCIKYMSPLEAFAELSSTFELNAVFTNHDYEPYATLRDNEIESFLKSKNISFHTFKDQVLFEKSEIVKDDGLPYTVYTPFSKKWKAALNSNSTAPYPSETLTGNFQKSNHTFPSLSSLGFESSLQQFPSLIPPIDIISNYHLTRDIPSILGTSKLSVHLRFGTISVRKLTQIAIEHNEKFLNELIWREFYQTILWHFPKVINSSFKPAYDAIQWRNNMHEFEAWCIGQTGYPIVDAGMRELNETGWMHNRVRMITASFLTKHLLIDWRWGEAYFAKKLLDFDLASNNGGWQWAAGSGVDAAPYFRIFNPALQTAKFDGKLEYIRKWVPEFESFEYPKPIVEHALARERCLETYKIALKKDE